MPASIRHNGGKLLLSHLLLEDKDTEYRDVNITCRFEHRAKRKRNHPVRDDAHKGSVSTKSV